MMHPVISKRTGDLIGVTCSNLTTDGGITTGYRVVMFSTQRTRFVSLSSQFASIDTTMQIVTGDTPQQTAIISAAIARCYYLHKQSFVKQVLWWQRQERYAVLWRDVVKEDGTILYQHELIGE